MSWREWGWAEEAEGPAVPTEPERWPVQEEILEEARCREGQAAGLEETAWGTAGEQRREAVVWCAVAAGREGERIQ